MNDLCLEIAGFHFLIRGQSPYMRRFFERYFRDFVSDGKPDLVIDIKDRSSSNITKILSGIVKERFYVTRDNGRFFVKSPKFEGRFELGGLDTTRGQAYLNNYGEHLELLLYQFLHNLLQALLNESHGFILHCCGLKRNGKGYIFIGPSRAGKSTIASLSPDSLVLSDDVICVKKIKKSYFIYGTPWRGKKTLPVPLNRIFFLEKGMKNKLKSMSAPSAIRKLFTNNMFYHGDKKSLRLTLNNAIDLALKIRPEVLRFSLNGKFWEKID